MRQKLAAMPPTRGLAVFAGAFILLFAALGLTGWLLLRPAAEIAEIDETVAFCRPCASLARLDRAMTLAIDSKRDMTASLTKDDRARIRADIAGWQQRCSTLLCSAPEETLCAAPPASLLTELASIDSVAAGLARRTELCASGGCQSARCDQASRADDAFANLHAELKALVDNPAILAGDRREVTTTFAFDRLDTLDDTVLAAPHFISVGRFAAAEVRLLYLRDEALAAESLSPESAEGLLADRLDEVGETIEAMAEGRRVGVAGAGLAALWREFAEANARLLVEVATLRAEMRARTDLLEAMMNPKIATGEAGADTVCEGTLKLVTLTEQRLAEAMAQLELCNQRADCIAEPDEDVTAATQSAPRGGGRRAVLERLAAERQAAAAALRPLSFQKDADVVLTTDLQQYFAGEAIAVSALSEQNKCLSDRGSRLVLAITPASGEEAQIVEEHPLDNLDEALWLFEAPPSPGNYRVFLETSQRRGAGRFGASSTFAVTPSEFTDCQGFAGYWQTDFGVLTIHVRGGIVRGSYRQSAEARAGLLDGVVDGDVLTGEWASELGKGGARLVLAPDGRSFTGTWSHREDRTSGSGAWNGVCVTMLPEPPPTVLPGQG